jgi:AraC-like DNA-binding protein
MLEKTILLIAALLGFMTIFLIGFRFKSKKSINFYLILCLFLSSFRFLIHGLPELFTAVYFQKQVDFIFFTFFWPFLYLYFGRLRDNHVHQKRVDFFHLITPIALCVLYFTNGFGGNDEVLIIRKIVTLIIIFLNAAYAVASFKLLSGDIWKRSSEILVVNQQNIVIKQWTQLLFYMFSLMLLRFFVNLLLNKSGLWYVNLNNYFWIGAVLWIILYVKILISPAFLHGPDVFQYKMNEYKKRAFVYDNIWITNNTHVINIQDAALKEKIGGSIQKYISEIEDAAVNTELFLIQNCKMNDLANKFNIPKSHVNYIFKYHCKVSFSDFKKIIRIQKAIELIAQGFLINNTLEALAAHTGFSSYSPFFKSFKSITGLSPKEYIE